jgi:elongation factor Ts
MAISANEVRELRELTGAGMLDCKNALEEANGDLEKAKEILRRKGIEIASRREERATVEGLIVSYIHHNGRMGSLLELNCETDFVARTEDFSELARKIALHIVGANPLYISEEEIPVGSKDDPKEVCLLLQPFVQDESLTIQDMINEVISKTGEQIRVRRFARFELGR